MAAARFGLGIIIGLLAACVITQSAVPQNRILDGEEATTGQFPYLVSLRVDSVHVAGGSIIDPLHILTVAHPFSAQGVTAIDALRVSARVGSTNQFAGGQIANVAKIVIHPSYGSFQHNLAIITLLTPLTFSDRIGAIALPLATDQLAEGTSVDVAGWGYANETDTETSFKLNHGKLTTLSAPTCELEAGYGYSWVLCLSHELGKGVCRGDEGAGVVAGNKLHGVVSFAFGGCGTKYPDVSALVSYYLTWIEANK